MGLKYLITCLSNLSHITEQRTTLRGSHMRPHVKLTMFAGQDSRTRGSLGAAFGARAIDGYAKCLPQSTCSFAGRS